VKSRGQGIVGLEQGIGENTALSASYYQSREVDYFSQAVVGTFTQDLRQKNFTVQLRGQYTWDDVGEVLSTGALQTYFKETQSGAASITQLLTPTLVLRVGADGMRQRGLLSDPYRLVARTLANGSPDTSKENHPNERMRQAGWVEISQYLPIEASILLHYRYYFDDWGVESHTGQIKLNKYVTSDLIATPEYRYYKQGAADFGDYAAGAGPDTYFTGDYKLTAFESNNFGLGLTYFLRGVAARRAAFDFLGGASLSLMYFRYWNSLDFAANVIESKVKFGF
jgi:hypothetical protein